MLIPFLIVAQKPQKILGIAKESFPKSYYAEQEELWKIKARNEPYNGEAWINYYNAARAYHQLTLSQEWDKNPEKVYKLLYPIILEVENAMGKSYEYYFLRGKNVPPEDAIPFLNTAFELDPDRREVIGWLFSYEVPRFNTAKADVLARKMLMHNIYSNANLMWNYNALAFLEKNAVFIANGDLDALPKWVLQHGKDIRKDVLVVSRHFLANNPEYREKIFKQLGVDKEIKSSQQFSEYGEYLDYLVQICLKNSKRPIYMPCGTDISLFKKYSLEDKMYMVGSVFKYSEEVFDNEKETIEKMGEDYLLEYLTINFQNHGEDHMINEMNLTYLPGLYKVKRFYIKQGDVKKGEYFHHIIDVIAERSGRKKEVLSWFE